jgi:hypothetical protein
MRRKYALTARAGGDKFHTVVGDWLLVFETDEPDWAVRLVAFRLYDQLFFRADFLSRSIALRP